MTLSVGCRLNWYRALPVSCVEHLALTVDGTRLIPDVIAVALRGRQIPVPALVEHDDCWWATGQVAWLHCALEPGSVKDRYLGFPMLRLNNAAPDLLAAILPTAERFGIRVVIELHAKPIRHPDSVRLAEYFDAVQSRCLGFLHDLGAASTSAGRRPVHSTHSTRSRRTIACSGPCGRRLAPRNRGPDERGSGAGTYIGGAYTAYRRCHLPATPGHADIGGTGRS